MGLKQRLILLFSSALVVGATVVGVLVGTPVKLSAQCNGDGVCYYAGQKYSNGAQIKNGCEDHTTCLCGSWTSCC
jgi:hypothetical protein